MIDFHKLKSTLETEAKTRLVFNHWATMPHFKVDDIFIISSGIEIENSDVRKRPIHVNYVVVFDLENIEVIEISISFAHYEIPINVIKEEIKKHIERKRLFFLTSDGSTCLKDIDVFKLLELVKERIEEKEKLK